MAQLSVGRPERDDVPWNFTVNVVDIMFITLGLSLVSRETVMPVLASQLTDSKLVIGLIPAIFSLGFYLPQLFMANFSEGLRYKKPFVMWLGGLGERAPYLLIGVRFTQKEGKLYATLLDTPASADITIQDLQIPGNAQIHLLGDLQPLPWIQEVSHLTVTLPATLPTSPAHTLRITL